MAATLLTLFGSIVNGDSEHRVTIKEIQQFLDNVLGRDFRKLVTEVWIALLSKVDLPVKSFVAVFIENG